MLCRCVFVCVPVGSIAISISCRTEIMWFCNKAIINRQLFNTSAWKIHSYSYFIHCWKPMAAVVCCMDRTAAAIFSIWPDSMTNRSVHGLWQQATDRLAEHICYHPNTKKHSRIHKHTHAICSAHTITSTERRENGVGRGERDWVGGSGRKRWRKRQRESRSEWHMAFSLKKDEQHETKTRIWIS